MLKDVSFCANILFCRRVCVSVVGVVMRSGRGGVYRKYLQVFLFALFSAAPHTFVFTAVDGRLRSTSGVWNANLHSSTQWWTDQRFEVRNSLSAFFSLFDVNAENGLAYFANVFVNFSCCFVNSPSLRSQTAAPNRTYEYTAVLTIKNRWNFIKTFKYFDFLL